MQSDSGLSLLRLATLFVWNAFPMLFVLGYRCWSSSFLSNNNGLFYFFTIFKKHACWFRVIFKHNRRIIKKRSYISLNILLSFSVLVYRNSFCLFSCSQCCAASTPNQQYSRTTKASIFRSVLPFSTKAGAEVRCSRRE